MGTGTEQKGGIWRGKKGSFVPFTYIGLALGREMVQGSTWYIWRVMWEPSNEHSYASVCLSVCLYMHEKESVPL